MVEGTITWTPYAEQLIQQERERVVKDVAAKWRLTTSAGDKDTYYTFILPPADDEPVVIQPHIRPRWRCEHCGRPNWLDRLTCEGCGAPEGEL